MSQVFKVGELYLVKSGSKVISVVEADDEFEAKEAAKEITGTVLDELYVESHPVYRVMKKV